MSYKILVSEKTCEGFAALAKMGCTMDSRSRTQSAPTDHPCRNYVFLRKKQFLIEYFCKATYFFKVAPGCAELRSSCAKLRYGLHSYFPIFARQNTTSCRKSTNPANFVRTVVRIGPIVLRICAITHSDIIDIDQKWEFIPGCVHLP